MKLKQYRVEIFGYIELDAKDEKDARNRVKEQFEIGELTYENLSFDVEDLSENNDYEDNDND